MELKREGDEEIIQLIALNSVPILVVNISLLTFVFLYRPTYSHETGELQVIKVGGVLAPNQVICLELLNN